MLVSAALNSPGGMTYRVRYKGRFDPQWSDLPGNVMAMSFMAFKTDSPPSIAADLPSPNSAVIVQ